MIDTTELEKVLVKKCVELYKEMLDEHKEIEKTDHRIDYGVPPKYILIKQYDGVEKTEHFNKGTIIKAWIYKDNELKSIPNDVAMEEDPERSGMYYKQATGEFYRDIENRKAYVNMSYGPRYGRGYSYDLILDAEEILLENEDVLWVS